ncbi:hypothetical protein QM012_002524 [Aureobasidium pullulans]|uniref:WD40 repeat-like protein n=1 Tax=Aureobasidium pullulans TaxID=5580 RepID=A0ABR0TCP5_AURPU
MTAASLLKRLEGNDSDGSHIAFSPDSSLFASVSSNDSRINIYLTESGVLQTRTIENEDMIWDLSFSPCSKHILAACDDGVARLFCTTTGALEKEFHDESEGWSDQTMFIARFTADARTIATGTDIVQLWNVDTGGLIRELIGPKDRDILPVASIEAMGNVLQDETSIASIDFPPDGRLLVSVGLGGWGSTSRIWDMHTGELKLESQGNAVVLAVNKTIFAVAENGEVKLWDTGTMTIKHTLQGGSPSLSPDGNCIATCSRSHTIYLWDVGTGHLLHTLAGYGTAAPFVLFTPESATLLSNCGRIVHIWDVTSGDLKLLLEDHEKIIHTMTLSPDGTTLATGSKDCSVRLWDTKTGQCLQVLEGHGDEVWGVTFSADGKRLVTSDDGGSVLLWKIE